jgi:glycosyltransferase involved in cell wall biosynthesis
MLPKGPPVAPALFTGLIVSSLIRGKGVPDFLDALAREVRPDDGFVLRIAGRTDIEPGTAAACLESVARHPLLRGRVIHLGHLALGDLGREYERSSAFISPSPFEGYGMAFHEARIFGLPVLARRAPYSEPFVEAGRTGFLFDSAAALARGMLDLVHEPERMERLGAAARERPESAAYTWRDAARSFLSQREGCGIVPAV